MPTINSITISIVSQTQFASETMEMLQDYFLSGLRLINRIGTEWTERVNIDVAFNTRSRHCSRVSPACNSTSTCQSRSRTVRSATDSVVANFLPTHALGPVIFRNIKGVNELITGQSCQYEPVLNMSTPSGSPDGSSVHHRDGLNSFGSGKYLGL